MRVYVAGPYSGPTEADRLLNVQRACEVGYELLLRGHNPFIPHLTHFFEEWAAEHRQGLSYEEYMRWDESWLTVCDALYYIGSSPGADIELEVARSYGLLVFESMEDVPAYD